MIIINFIRPQSGGNQRYTLELLKFLEKQSFLKYKVLLGSCNLKYFDKKLCDDYLIRYTPRNLLFSMIFESFWLTVQKSKLNCILFSPNTLVPFFLGRFKKNIVTVHDMNFTEIYQGLLKNIYKKALYKRAINRCYKLIVVSEFVKQEVIRFACNKDIDSKINVIWNGIGGNFLPAEEVTSKVYKGKDFLITFGHQPHKNVEEACEIYNILKRRNDRIILVVIGSGPHINFLKKKNRKDKGIVFTGFVSDCELVELYNNALAMLFLSTYEGFGLPVLEAFSQKCPVVISDQPALVEVAGGYAYVHKNINLTSEYLCKVMKANSQIKNKLDDAKDYAAQFQWDNQFKRYLEILK